MPRNTQIDVCYVVAADPPSDVEPRALCSKRCTFLVPSMKVFEVNKIPRIVVAQCREVVEMPFLNSQLLNG